MESKDAQSAGTCPGEPTSDSSHHAARMGTVVVVVPIYRRSPKPEERLSLSRLFSLLQGHEIVFVHPQGLNLESYGRWPSKRIALPEVHFQSGISYSRLLMSRGFYELFPTHEFLLLHQPDVFLCHGDLGPFLAEGVDYVGAPWMSPIRCLPWIFRGSRFLKIPGLVKTLHVGNGGLSLRRVEKTIQVLEGNRLYAAAARLAGAHEDLFFASLKGEGPSRLRIPDPKFALTFAIDRDPRLAFQANAHQLPLGFHNPWGYDRAFFVDEVLPRCGLTASDLE